MNKTTCQHCGRPRLLDAFSGEGGAGVGYQRAGFCVTPVDMSKKRLDNYPTDCPAATPCRGDALWYIAKLGHQFAAGHGSPTCTGYSQGTAALPDRVTRYDRLIPAIREAFEIAGIPYVIENVYGARKELRNPVMLCGRQFDLTAVDDDGTKLTLDRHRLFEVSGFPLLAPEHTPHPWQYDRKHGIQVAGSYGGARRDKREAREVRKGGYVPASLDVQRALLGTPWMSEKGCQLSIPPAYTEFIGRQLLAHIESERAA